MAIAVTDALSNQNDHKVNIATALARSARLKKVFTAIYAGKQKAKTTADIIKITKLKNVAVLQQGAKLAHMHVVDTIKINGKTAYQKVSSVTGMKDAILRLSSNAARLKSTPTKVSPKGNGASIRFALPGRKVQITQITIDDFDEFQKFEKSEAPLRKLFLSANLRMAF